MKKISGRLEEIDDIGNSYIFRVVISGIEIYMRNGDITRRENNLKYIKKFNGKILDIEYEEYVTSLKDWLIDALWRDAIIPRRHLEIVNFSLSKRGYREVTGVERGG